MTPGTTIYRLERQSSLTESGKHVTKYVVNPNARGGFVKSKAVLVEATSRKGKTVTNSKQTLRNNAGKTDDFATEICRNAPSNKNEVLTKIMDRQSPEDVAKIASSSKAINETNKISDESGAALAIDAGLTQNQLRKMRRAGNNQLKRFLPSEVKINRAKRKRLGSLVSGDYVLTDIKLQIRREGKEKKILNSCGVVYVRNYKQFVTKVIAEELSELKPTILPDGVREIEVGIAGDSGGGSMKLTMSLMNRIDTKVKLHVLLMYEAADTKMNNIRTFSLLTEEIKALNGDTIDVEGKTFRIKQKGMFDLSAQDDIVGKQNSSSTFPCSKCTVTLAHLQNHGGREHSSKNCIDGKNIVPKTYKWFEDNLQEVVRNVALRNKSAERTVSDGNDASQMIIKNLEDRKKAAKSYGNVISVNLLEFEDLQDMPDPLMHILMGLTNDNLNSIRKDAKELDDNENQERNDQEAIDKVYENLTTKQDLELEYIENSREMKNMKNMLKLVSAGQLKEAEIAAKNNYKNKLKKQKQSRSICNSTFCLLFPIDIQEGYDRIVECKNGCQPHTLCEGLSDFSYPILLDDEEYLCNKCEGFSKEEIDGKFQSEIDNLDLNVKKLELEINSHLMMAKNLEQRQEKNIGEYEKMYTAGLKELHTEEQSYHGKYLQLYYEKDITLFYFAGGSLNGKDVEKILSSALNSETIMECPVLNCISVNKPDRANKYLQLFKVLANVWMTMRIPNEKLDDEDLQEITNYCQEWSKLLPVLFPERNITQKGHVLSIHIPQYLAKYRSFYRYYKLEQMGESIHAKMNMLMRRLAPVRPNSRRLWKIIEHYEMMNKVDQKHLEKRKKKNTGRTIAATLLTTLGILLLAIV